MSDCGGLRFNHCENLTVGEAAELYSKCIPTHLLGREKWSIQTKTVCTEVETRRELVANNVWMCKDRLLEPAFIFTTLIFVSDLSRERISIVVLLSCGGRYIQVPAFCVAGFSGRRGRLGWRQHVNSSSADGASVSFVVFIVHKLSHLLSCFWFEFQL